MPLRHALHTVWSGGALRSPWFAGFFGFTGHLHAWHLLRGRWRLAGAAATAAATGHAYFGGFPLTTGSAIASYLLLVVAPRRS